MTRTQYLLMVGAEECMELAERLLKASRFGIDQVQPPSHEDGKTDSSSNPERLSNRQRISREFADLVGVLMMLKLETIEEDRAKDKILKVERYIRESILLGTMQGPLQ